MTKDILPPKNDVVFKLLFGDQRNEDLLIDFLKADQIDIGEEYGSIKRVITILITDYVLIPESERYHHRFTLFDPESAIEFTDLMEIYTLELPKLPEMADNYLWHWLRFLRAESKEDLDIVAQASPELKKTVVKLLELSEDEEARMIYEAEVKAARDERARMRSAREEGKSEGIAVGKSEGRMESKLEIARKLLDMKMPTEIIVQATGIPSEDIETLLADSE
jgi:predicted transposase/invertase (TIGR01784 family)